MEAETHKGVKEPASHGNDESCCCSPAAGKAAAVALGQGGPESLG